MEPQPGVEFLFDERDDLLDRLRRLLGIGFDFDIALRSFKNNDRTCTGRCLVIGLRPAQDTD